MAFIWKTGITSRVLMKINLPKNNHVISCGMFDISQFQFTCPFWTSNPSSILVLNWKSIDKMTFPKTDWHQNVLNETIDVTIKLIYHLLREIL